MRARFPRGGTTTADQGFELDHWFERSGRAPTGRRARPPSAALRAPGNARAAWRARRGGACGQGRGHQLARRPRHALRTCQSAAPLRATRRLHKSVARPHGCLCGAHDDEGLNAPSALSRTQLARVRDRIDAVEGWRWCYLSDSQLAETRVTALSETRAVALSRRPSDQSDDASRRPAIPRLAARRRRPAVEIKRTGDSERPRRRRDGVLQRR